MPTCQKFFEELGECLIKSDCNQKYGVAPSNCLQLLMQAKAFSQITKEDQAARGNNGHVNYDSEKKSLELEVDPKAPLECAKVHQSYSECRIALMNPKSRFRGAYGS
jgi:hypothetical protein